MGKSVIRKKINAKGARASGGGGGAVSSFNGRTGAVVPTPGDYLPVDLAYADITTETNAGNLIDGQLYNITGFPAFTSTIQLQNIYVFAHLDDSVDASPIVVLDYECVANYSNTGNQNQVTMRYDWYASQILSIQDRFGNHIEGNTKCTNWPFGNGWENNKFGFNFVLDMTVAPTSINNCVGLGSGTLTTTARVYENIDLDKGYFEFNFQFSFDGVTPKIVIQKNELGDVPAIGYSSAGIMDLTSISVFGATIDKCNIIFQHVYDGASFVTMTADWNNPSKIAISIWDTLTGLPNDLTIPNASFRVQVYF